MSEKHLVFAAYYHFREQPERAIQELDELLRRHPGNLSGLAMKAELLAEQHKIEEALDYYDQAIGLFYTIYGDAEPPRLLLRERRRLLDQMLQRAIDAENDKEQSDADEQ